MYLLWKIVNKLRYPCKLCSFDNFQDNESVIHSNILLLNIIFCTTSIVVYKEQPWRNKIMRRRKEIIFLWDMIAWFLNTRLSLWTIDIEANSNIDLIFSLNYIKPFVRDSLNKLDYLSFVVIVPSTRSTS